MDVMGIFVCRGPGIIETILGKDSKVFVPSLKMAFIFLRFLQWR